MIDAVKIFVLFIFSCLSAFAAESDYNWHLEHNEKDIKIYLQNNFSAIKTFKGEAIIDTSVDSILHVLTDIDACPDWFSYCKKPIIIDDVSSTERYHYMVNTVPFPATNRDFIFHSKITKDPLTNIVNITMKAVPDYCLDKHSDACQIINKSSNIRVRNARGYYILEPMGGGATKVTWVQYTDPAGCLPKWLVNLMLKNVPLTALQGLKRKTQEEKYQQEKFDFGSDILPEIAGLEQSK